MSLKRSKLRWELTKMYKGMDTLDTLKRRDLQYLCKTHNLKGNMKNSEMVKALEDLRKKKQSPCVEDCVNDENKSEKNKGDGVLPVNPVPVNSRQVEPVRVSEDTDPGDLGVPVSDNPDVQVLDDPTTFVDSEDTDPGDLGVPVSDNPDVQVLNGPTTFVEDQQQSATPLSTPLVESIVDTGLATPPVASSTIAPPTNNDSSPVIAEPDTTKATAEGPHSASIDQYAVITADEVITSTWTPPCVIESSGNTIEGPTLSPIRNKESPSSIIEGSPIHNEGSATSTIEGSRLSPIHNEESASSIFTNNSELSFTMDNASMRVNVGSPFRSSQNDTSSLSFSTCFIASQTINNTDTTPIPSSIANTLNTTYTIESPEKEITVEGTTPGSVLSESLTLTPSNSKHLGASPLCGSWLARDVTTSTCISQLACKTSTAVTRTSTVESPLVSSKDASETESNVGDVKQNVSSYHSQIMSLLDSRVENIMNDPSYKPPASETSSVAKSNTAVKKRTITSKFDKIHARQFNRMESIVDSAQRKRKRLETITNETPSCSDITTNNSKKAKIQEPVKPKLVKPKSAKRMTSTTLNRLATPKRINTTAEKKTLNSSKPAPFK